MDELNAIEGLTLLLNFIDAVGTVGLLAIIVWAFYTGRVVSKVVMERMLQEAEARTEKLVKELHQSIKEAVREGVAQGMSQSKRRRF